MRGLGYSLGVGGAGRGGVLASWTPRTLFADGEAGAWFDTGATASLFADTGGTVPAAVDGPVARMADRSGRGHHVSQGIAAARPILRRDVGGRAYLAFDGVDDCLAVTAPELRFTGPTTLAIAVRREFGGAYDIWMSAQTFAGSINPYEFRSNSSGVPEFVAANAASVELADAGTITLPLDEDRVVTAARTESAIEFASRGFGGGTEATSSAAHALIPTADAQTEFRLGSRKGSPLFARGRLYAALAIGRPLTRAEGAALREYMAASAGMAA